MIINMEWIIEIRFGVSRSKLYKKAVLLAQSLPNFELNNGITFCGTDDIKECITFFTEFQDLVFMVQSWKGSEILMYGKSYITINDFWDFRRKVEQLSGKYYKLLANSQSITYESLPLPIVYYPQLYGAFFAFSYDIDGDIYFCECERIAIENYIKLRKQKPLENYTGSKTNPLGTDYFPELVSQMSLNNPKSPLDIFKFKEKICFYCNNIIPKLRYCNPMYGDIFKQKYGWLINQEYFALGIDPHKIMFLEHPYNILPEYFPENIDVNTYSNKEISRYVENSVRQHLGFKKIGETWTSETTLYYIIKGLYPYYKVIMHYRPEWLNGLELDIYIPALKLAFEYQGIQHFKPIEHWGGSSQLLKQKEHDKRKIKLCKAENVTLIHINYDEELTEINIKMKIKQLYNPQNNI